MRRLAALTSLLIALAVPATGSAQPGAAEIVLNTDGYLLKTVTLPQGSELAFANLDLLNAHTVTASDYVDDLPLFYSGTVEPRETKTMTDVAALPAGDYGFYCSVHTGMLGLLQVR